MSTTVSSLPVASARLHNGGMADWERLGKLVIARRVDLGYKTRIPLAEASGISTRILGDIETGRRGRFDPKTIAALENTLGWATGSVDKIIGGGDPDVLPVNVVINIRESVGLSDSAAAAVTPAGTDTLRAQDEALARVMRSNLSESKKREVMRILLEERARDERKRVEHAEDLIRLLDDGR